MNRLTAILALAATFAVAPGLQAQEVQDDPVRQELHTLAAEGDQAQADRAAVADFLDRSDVQRVAAERGIDLERLEAGVRTMSAGQAASLAERVQDAEQDLAGGDTFVISTTTIIIALLIIIIIIVA